MSVTEIHLQDLRRRIVDFDKRTAAGEADPSQPPYTLDELREAVKAISLDRERIASTDTRKKASTKKVDLTDLIG